MNKQNRASVVSLWANRVLMVVIVALTVGMPGILAWYSQIRVLQPGASVALLVSFYLCVPVSLFALGTLDRLLRNIIAGAVFVRGNVGLIRRVCLCCMAVSVICLPAACLYPPLVFFSIVMLFLCPVVGVVRSVFDAAVTIREENDLTI